MSSQYPPIELRNSHTVKIVKIQCCHSARTKLVFECIRTNNQNTYRDLNMDDDERCCGTGTCIIDTEGQCWCGQQWDGEKMCRPSQIGAPPYPPNKQHNLEEKIP